MKDIKVLGSGCKRCSDVAALIQRVAESENVEIDLQKVTDAKEMMNYRILNTPAVVVDNTVVYSGGIPVESDVKKWLHG